MEEITTVTDDNWQEIRNKFSEKCDVEIDVLDMEKGIPPDYLQDNTQTPILDIQEFCKKLENKYDKDWTMERFRVKDVEKIRKNLIARATQDGIDNRILEAELHQLTPSSIMDVPRFLCIDNISSIRRAPKPVSPPSPALPPPLPAKPKTRKSRNLTKKTLRCGPCLTECATKALLLSHWNEAHPALLNAFVLEPAPRCMKCLKIFMSPHDLTLHVGSTRCTGQPNSNTVLELASKLRCCPGCSKLFETTESASVCLADGHNQIRCYLCLAMFPYKTEDGSKNQLTKHAKEFHGKAIPGSTKVVFPCPFCPIVVGNNRILVEHLVEVHYDPCLKEAAEKNKANSVATATARKRRASLNNQGGDSASKEPPQLILIGAPTIIGSGIPFRINPAALGRGIELRGNPLRRGSLDGRIVKIKGNMGGGRFILPKTVMPTPNGGAGVIIPTPTPRVPDSTSTSSTIRVSQPELSVHGAVSSGGNENATEQAAGGGTGEDAILGI